MRCCEEARRRYSGGRRVGLEGRASLLRFGEAWDRSLWRSPEEANTVNLFELLRWVAMSPGENGTLLVPVTIPRRLLHVQSNASLPRNGPTAPFPVNAAGR